MALAVIILLAVGGCSWIGINDRRDRYLEARSIPRVRIPEQLDRPNFTDLMEIPPVTDSRGLAGRDLDIGLPEALGTGFGVDKIVIKKLGDSRWVFLDASPATVWPKVKQFWESHDLPIARADPGRGILETEWLISGEGDAEAVFKELMEGRSWADDKATLRNKFRIEIQPGVRSGSCEVHLTHKQIPLGAPYRTDTVAWDGKSDNAALEEEALTRLAYYLGETINQRQSVSLLAAGIREQRTELIPDDREPVLRYKLPFNRAWATVGAALENARIPVEDLDRSSAVYYVNYDDSRVDSPGLFRRWFSDEEDIRPGSENRYLVHLSARKGDQVDVTVKRDENTPADALVAERLLKIIKEHST